MKNFELIYRIFYIKYLKQTPDQTNADGNVLFSISAGGDQSFVLYNPVNYPLRH